MHSKYILNLGYRVGHHNGCVKFECNDRYHWYFTKKKKDSEQWWFKPRIYFPMGDKKVVYVLMT